MATSTDTRVVYGAVCSWWGSIGEVGAKPSGLPCCPHCGGPLFEMESEEVWWASVDAYEADGHPLYREFVEWLRTVHYPSVGAAMAAWEGRRGEPPHVDFTPEQLAAIESQPGRCPELLEGNDAGSEMGAVVGDRRYDSRAKTTTAPASGPAKANTITVGQLVEALDGLPADMPVFLEVLGDLIETDGLAVLEDEVRIVGGEVEG